jgi:hypothetical protein
MYVDCLYVEEFRTFLLFDLQLEWLLLLCLAACEFRCNAGVMEYLATFVNNPDCIKQSEVCDGHAFCADGQDEKGCGKCMLSNIYVHYLPYNP